MAAAQQQIASVLASLGGDPDIPVDRHPTVMQAQARLDNARSRHERIRRLASSRSASVEEQDTAASEFRAAQAEHASQLLQARAGLATARMKQTALAVARQQLADSAVRTPTPTLPVPGRGDVDYVVTQRAVAEARSSGPAPSCSGWPSTAP